MNGSQTRTRGSAADDRPIILWVTNLAAPYRIPVWVSLAACNSLIVMLLESNAQLADDSASNRGEDWQVAASEKFTIQAISTWKFSHGEARYYALRRILPLLRMRRPDVVVFGGWESPAYWQLMFFAILFRCRRVAFYESPSNTHRHRRGPISWMRSLFYKLMHSTVVPGPAARMSLLQMGVNPDAIAEGFNAVDVQRFQSTSSPEASNCSTEILDGHRFLYAGQLIARKRVDRIIDAFSQIGCDLDQVDIVGVGPLENQLKALAAERRANVFFHGYVDGALMPAMMAETQTLVLSSAQEVWGLVVNEALASGMHVVVAENCGVIPSIRGMPGVFIAREDLSDLAQQMKKSRDAWAGRIRQPEILQHTPEKFADVFQAVFDRCLRPVDSRAT